MHLAWRPSGHPSPTWPEARQLAFDCAVPLAPVDVPLPLAVGRTLTRDVAALQKLPHYDSSAMDGWAINGGGPWILTDHEPFLFPGSASVIATGGLVPAGAQSILRKESGQIHQNADGSLLLRLNDHAKEGEPGPGQHLRPAGEEAAAGEVLIPAGTILNPAHLALAAVAGHDELQVQAKPVVAIVLTGSEVVTQGVPAPGQVRDTFGPQLGTVISLLGGTPAGSLRIGDSYPEWLAALGGSDAFPGQMPDVIVTTGGTGCSGTDHFRAAVAALGGRLLLDGIAMRPGHPAVLAELPDGHFVVGLPGNPLAAMMALITLADPLLAALGGRPLSAVGQVTSAADVDPYPGRTRLLPCRFIEGLAFPASHTGPGMMRGLAWADGVMAVPPGGVQSGGPVPVLPLPWTQANQTILSTTNRARSTAWPA
ncbi:MULTISPECIES: molybdopterin molybdotransferase MoeA [unclassified Arthrobacter]|uniref:molybdopterin molybdotransferase MoeA n=1 Tax=unclassified Arthrobacter TaxID=235627 RepID=UPI0027D89A53|nr:MULTISPECIES: molybdopterin molybdotransferase MoeA [unclassified Arthrobacter]